MPEHPVSASPTLKGGREQLVEIDRAAAAAVAAANQVDIAVEAKTSPPDRAALVGDRAASLANVHATGVCCGKDGRYYVRLHVHTACLDPSVVRELGLTGGGGTSTYRRLFRDGVPVEIYAVPPAELLMAPAAPTPPGGVVLTPGDPLHPATNPNSRSTLGYIAVDGAGQPVVVSAAHGFAPYIPVGGRVINSVPGGPVVATLLGTHFGGDIDVSGLTLASGVGYNSAIPGIGLVGRASSLAQGRRYRVDVYKRGSGSGMTIGNLTLSPPTFTMIAQHPITHAYVTFRDQLLVVNKAGSKQWVSRPGDSGAAAVIQEHGPTLTNRVIGILWCGDSRSGGYYYVCPIDKVKAALGLVTP
jgi:hypothetical protein